MADIYFGYIFFFYGLAFFSMGLALLIESRRASQFQLARAGHSLGLFGVLHGCHEFVEMFVIFEDITLSLWGDGLRIVLLAASFLPLLAFGVQMLPRSERVKGFTGRMLVLAAITYLMLVVIVRLTFDPTPQEWLDATDVLARYTIAIPGAALSGLALMRQRRAMQEAGMTEFGQDLALAALALTWYGVIGQWFPKPSVIFPSMYLNTEVFLAWFGFPVQLLRAVLAVVVALAMIRALRAFDKETQHQIARAQETEIQLQNAARELALLYEASNLLTSTHDLDRVLQETINRIVQVIEPIKTGLIRVPSGRESEEDYFASVGYSAARLQELKKGFLCASCRCDSQPGNGLCWATKDAENVRALIGCHDELEQLSQVELDIQRVVLPLQMGSHFVGTVMLETDPNGPYLSSHDAPTILALTRQLAIAIDNAQLVLKLRQREELRGGLLQRATAAQEAERKRIARELHDETGQALTAISLGLKGIEQLIKKSPDQAIQQVGDLRQISSKSLEDLRHLISNLRPSHLDDLGLVAAVRWYIEQLHARSAVDFTFTPEGTPYRLSPEKETTLFRIVQEGLNNIVKHSGAGHADVTLTFSPGEITLRIKDDGCGFHTEQVMQPGAGRAWGLIGIQERVALTQGKFEVRSKPGAGTAVLVRIPTSPVEEDFEQKETV